MTTEININTLIEIASSDEAKILYYTHRTSCECPDETNCDCPEEWDTVTLTNGGSAHCVVSGNTITVTFVNGTISTYTHDGSEILINANLTGQIVT